MFQFPVPHLDYSWLLVLIASVVVFGKAAQMEGRSPLVWGGLSLGLWLASTQFLVGGIVGGVLSQVLLFAGLAALAMARNRDGARAEQTGRGVPVPSELIRGPESLSDSSDPPRAR